MGEHELIGHRTAIARSKIKTAQGCAIAERRGKARLLHWGATAVLVLYSALVAWRTV